MRVLERWASVAFVAGFGFFGFAFLAMGVLPWLLTDRVAPVQSGASFDAKFLPREVPLPFRAKYPDVASFKAGIDRGRRAYIAEGCWHCHTQFVRPVGNETVRYGPVSENWEYQNEMNLPQLFGTRRVGPDLIREAGRRSNDWHFAHFRSPTDVVPESVMPAYGWMFDDEGRPNDRAWDLTAYVQWLGSWRARPGAQP